jgi:hypothetical protein
MKKYEMYIIRRDLLADAELETDVLRGALIVLEHLDWNTKTKSFNTKRHLTNWLKSFADTYDIDSDDISAGIDCMRAGGFMEYQINKGQIALTVSQAEQLVC